MARPGRKPKFDPDAPEIDNSIDRMLGHIKPTLTCEDPDFRTEPTKENGRALIWPAFDVRLELTAAEWQTVKTA